MPRGSLPGEHRGSRKRGTPNKRTQEIINRLDALGCDPISGMAKIAEDESAPIEIRASMYKELARHYAPRRRQTPEPVAV